MSDWKYVIIECKGLKYPVLFPAAMIHKDVALALAPLVPLAAQEAPIISSAGSCASLAVTATVDRSETLGLASRPEDRLTINLMPYSGGAETPLGARYEAMVLTRHIEMALKTLKGMTG